MTYACETNTVAVREKLAQGNGVFPDNQHFVEIEIPRGGSYEVVTTESVPGWEPQASDQLPVNPGCNAHIN